MNPTHSLPSLLVAAGAAWLALPLAVKPSPAAPETCAPAGTVPAAPGPIGAIRAHLCGFHFYSGDLKRAVRVEHFCAQPNADVMQCVVYDSDRPDARLVGVEYIISEARFIQLPAEEKTLWHSHRYEVMSGLLTAPGLAAGAERELMKMFVTTYGKTWTLWQVDRGDTVPLGLPKLMMGYTAAGQLDPGLVAARDRDLEIASALVQSQRADLPVRPVAAGADDWQHGPSFQINDDLLSSARPAPRP